MKNIKRKFMSLLMSAVILVTSLSLSCSSAFAENQISDETTLSDTDYGITTGGLLSELMSEQIQNMTDKNQAAYSREHAIHKVDYYEDVEKFVVDYTSKGESTIFIGFYNDAGTQLYTSITETAADGIDAKIAVDKPAGLPEYYLIKAFMVGPLQNPLTDAYTNDKYTKAVQEIINKTADDYEESKIIRFNDTDNDNFIVTKDEYVTIYSDDKKDTLVVNDDENYILSFENIDKVAELTKGQTVLVYTPDDMLLFKVDDISIEGDTATLFKQVLVFDDLISFVKFDSSNFDIEETEEEIQLNDEWGGTYGISNENTSPSQTKENDNTRYPAPDMSFLNHLIPSIKPHIKLESKGAVKATVEFGAELELEIYYDSSSRTNSLLGKYGFYVELAAEGSWEGFKIPASKIPVLRGLFSLSICPDIIMRETGKFSIRISKTGCFGKGASNSCDYDTKTELKTEASVEVEISAEFKISIDFISEYIASIDLIPKAGYRFKTFGESDLIHGYIRHECKDNCITGEHSIFAGLSFEISFLDHNLIDVDLSDLGLELEWDLGEFHIKNGKKIEEACKNMKRKFIFTVFEPVSPSNNQIKPAEGASVYYKSDKEGPSLFLDERGLPVKADADGKIELWLKDMDLINPKYFLVFQTADRRTKRVEPYKQWNPSANKAQELYVYIDGTETDSFLDPQINYPVHGQCGYIDNSYIEPREDPVFFDYYSDGDCWVTGNGVLRLHNLFDLMKNDLKRNEIKELRICSGVKLADDRELSADRLYGSSIQSIVFSGSNGLFRHDGGLKLA